MTGEGRRVGPWLGALALPALILIIAVATGLAEPRFWSVANLQNLARQLAPLLILVTGQMFAVVSRGLDLSIAANMALAGVVGVLVVPQAGLGLALPAMVLAGLGIGLANGLIIVAFSVSPLIVTLGMLSVARGLALLFTAGLPLYNVPDALVDLVGFGTVLGVPVSSVIAFAVMALAAAVLRTTIFGRYVYAIGSNPVAARNSGVNVRLVTLLVYVVSGMMAGIAAIVLTAWVSAAQPLAGEGLELQSLAAVVIGGVALAGGSGTMPQAFYGALILGLLSNALNMAGVSSFLQTLAIGIVILIAVVVDRLRARHG
ncbi:MAG TPA: ABC transporter permease [Alphaproteobacteria bacterium]|nr:ABC transporter permease [Alphaproteobacteria bacterium]